MTTHPNGTTSDHNHDDTDGGGAPNADVYRRALQSNFLTQVDRKLNPPPATGALKAGGVLPFVNFNRVHIVPPLNIGDEDLLAGLAVLDEALTLADAHVE